MTLLGELTILRGEGHWFLKICRCPVPLSEEPFSLLLWMWRVNLARVSQKTVQFLLGTVATRKRIIEKLFDEICGWTEKVCPVDWGQCELAELNGLFPIEQCHLFLGGLDSSGSLDRKQSEEAPLEKKHHSVGTFAIFLRSWARYVPAKPDRAGIQTPDLFQQRLVPCTADMFGEYRSRNYAKVGWTGNPRQIY